MARRPSAQVEFDQLSQLIGESRQNLISCAVPEQCHEYKYLRPPAVGPVASGISAVSDDQDAGDQERTVWVADPEEGFVEGQVLATTAEGKLEVYLNTETVTVSEDSVQDANPTCFDYCEDMARLTHLNEASILHNLKQRYRVNLLHTYSGLFCITVNPWRRLPVYSPAIVSMYKGRQISEMPPHIFAIADNAYNNMLQNQEDQSVLITGESGAGKTENTKKIMSYFAIIAKSQQNRGISLEEQILETNPVLETFGNAKTAHNDNSSRFGKFNRMLFDSNGKLSGAEIESYLLEKSRVISQGAQDRSYHIFYQILSEGLPDIKELLGLEGKPSDYRFLSQGCEEIETVDDSKEMKSTEKALNILGFTGEERLSLYKITAGVLLMGEIKFVQRSAGDQAYVNGLIEPSKVCGLFGINMHKFLDALTEPKVVVGDEVVRQSRNLQQVLYSVQAVAKSVYEKMFRWLVKRCNKSISGKVSGKSRFVGILDIAGFEIFTVNSFEQLCINLTNEKLQQFFNHRMFVKEQQEYQKEKIPWDYIDFGMDLQPCIDLIEKPMGIFSLLEEECMVPKGTDKGLAEKLCQHHLKKHNSFGKPKNSKKGGQKGDFSVKHYAGIVNYNVEGWLDKNKDPLNEAVIELFQNSEDALLSEIWQYYGTTGFKTNVANTRGRRKQSLTFLTVSSVYRDQLGNLIDTLNRTNPQFVRCIVPNYERKPGLMDGNLVLHQLRCNGVLEGIRICRRGYPNRVTYEDFKYRYRILCPNKVDFYHEPSEATRILCDNLKLERKKDYELGVTKIFCRAGIVGRLESERNEKLRYIFSGLQAHVRWYLAEKKTKWLHDSLESIVCIQNNIRQWISMRSWKWFRLATHIKPLVREPMEELKREADRLEKENETLEKKLEAVEFDKNNLKREISRMETRTALVLETAKSQEYELNYIKDEKNRQEQLMEKLQDSLASQGQDLMCLKSTLKEEQNRLKSLKNTNASMEKTVAEMETSLQKERKAREKIEEQHSRSGSELRELQRKMKSLQDEKTQMEQTIANHKDNTEAHNAAVREQKDKVAALQSHIKQLEARIDELENVLLQEKLARKRSEKKERSLNEDIDDLQSKIKRLENSLASQLEQNRVKSSEISRLEQQLQASTSKGDDAIANMRKRHATALENLQEQIEQLHKKSLKLDSENQQLKVQLDNDSWANDPMRYRATPTRSRRGSVQLESLQYQAKMQESLMTRSFTTMRSGSCTDMLGKRAEALEKENKELRTDKRLLNREIDAYKKTLEDEMDEKEGLHKIIKVLRDDWEKSLKQVELEEERTSEVQRMLTKAQGETMHWKARCEAQVLELEGRLTEDKKKLSAKLKEASDELESLTNRYHMCERSREDLQLELQEKNMDLQRQAATISNLHKLQRSQEKALDQWTFSFKEILNETEMFRAENSELRMDIHALKKQIESLKAENEVYRTSSGSVTPGSDSPRSVSSPLCDSLSSSSGIEIDELRSMNIALLRELEGVKQQLCGVSKLRDEEVVRLERELRETKEELAQFQGEADTEFTIALPTMTCSATFDFDTNED